ncbi:MAG: AbrB/MazE/SpoVT family DNA-binding domain-containing protein [Candidatus Thermoplasmatota archaeon]
MDTRKVQLIGGTTLSVSLPKTWVDRVGLKPGDRIGFDPRPDGRLVLRLESASGAAPAAMRGVTLDATFLTPEQLTRRIDALYLSGADRFEVTSRHPFTAELSAAIDRFPRKIAGFEIIEQSPQRIILHDMVNPQAFDLYHSFDRVYGVASSIHREILSAMTSRDAARLARIQAKAEDVNRLRWVAAKQERRAIESELPLSRLDAFACASAIDLAQRLGHNGAQLGDAVGLLLRSEVEERVLSGLVEVGTRALTICDEAARAFYKADLVAAEAALDRVGPFDERMAELADFATTITLPPKRCGACLTAGRLLEAMSRTRLVGARFAELAIQRALATTPEGL